MPDATPPPSDSSEDGSEAPAVDTDEVLAAALAQGMRHSDAGALIGRSSKYVQRRLADSHFSAMVDEARAAALNDILGRVTHLSATGLDAVEGDLKESVDPALRLRITFASIRAMKDLTRTSDLAAQLRETEKLAKTLRAALRDLGIEP